MIGNQDCNVGGGDQGLWHCNPRGASKSLIRAPSSRVLTDYIRAVKSRIYLKIMLKSQNFLIKIELLEALKDDWGRK